MLDANTVKTLEAEFTHQIVPLLATLHKAVLPIVAVAYDSEHELLEHLCRHRVVLQEADQEIIHLVRELLLNEMASFRDVGDL